MNTLKPKYMHKDIKEVIKKRLVANVMKKKTYIRITQEMLGIISNAVSVSRCKRRCKSVSVCSSSSLQEKSYRCVEC